MDKKRELTLVRVFDAPREVVFHAWTDSSLLEKWWGPRGVTTPICEFDATQGGPLKIVMVAGEELGELSGSRWPMVGVVKEISFPEKLVFTSDALESEDGNVILQNLNTITFEEMPGKTKVTVHIQVLEAGPSAEGPLAGMEMGWTQSLDKLGEFLSK